MLRNYCIVSRNILLKICIVVQRAKIMLINIIKNTCKLSCIRKLTIRIKILLITNLKKKNNEDRIFNLNLPKFVYSLTCLRYVEFPFMYISQ